MKTYTFSQARQRLASLLDEALREGEVRIRRRDGSAFVVHPAADRRSPLDVPAITTDLTTDEIVAIVRASRRPRRTSAGRSPGPHKQRHGQRKASTSP
jgi:hypothetical protein